MVCCRKACRARAAATAVAEVKNTGASTRCPFRSRCAARAQEGLKVDGYFGWQTAMKLQLFLRDEGVIVKTCCGKEDLVPVTGCFGRKTKKGLKTFLKAKGYGIDDHCGWWCRRETRALQAWLQDEGAEVGPIDGRWWCRTTKALQDVLNTKNSAKDNMREKMETAADETVPEKMQESVVEAPKWRDAAPVSGPGNITLVSVVKVPDAAGAA